MNRAVVSIGTNSTRLLVVSNGASESPSPVYHETRGTRLGVGLRDGGTFDSAAVERTIAAIEAYVTIAHAHDATIAVIATSAMRRADDAPAVADRIAAIAGAPVRILSGPEEARFSFAGATAGRTIDGATVAGVLDVGGGSAEYAAGDVHGGTVRTLSIEIGAVRAAERFPDALGRERLSASGVAQLEKAMRQAIAAELAPLRAFARPDVLYAVGGTVMTSAAIVTGRSREDSGGVTLRRADLGALATRLLGATKAERLAIPKMNQQRADILPAGILVVDEACAALRSDALETSIGDLLLGFLTSS